MAYTVFCLRYEDECRAKPLFRAGAVRLTEERWADIKQVNQTVNSSRSASPGQSISIA
jgi:predicted transglutaminase-like cysteine proteinase